jgi:hypothetical protein
MRILFFPRTASSAEEPVSPDVAPRIMNYPAASRPHTPLSLRKAGYRWRNSILEQ